MAGGPCGVGQRQEAAANAATRDNTCGRHFVPDRCTGPSTSRGLSRGFLGMSNLGYASSWSLRAGTPQPEPISARLLEPTAVALRWLMRCFPCKQGPLSRRPLQKEREPNKAQWQHRSLLCQSRAQAVCLRAHT